MNGIAGRQPIAVTSCCDDKWGDWRPHLAMILSNSSSKSELDKKSILTLGDTLSSRGFLFASHFCYIVAQMDFGYYSNKTSKVVLLSSSAAQPFDLFATSEAIQCTEVYEYARQLASPDYVIPSFQSYKVLYANRLAEHGRCAEALQYCEAVATTLTKDPTFYPVSMMKQVAELGSMLKFSDPQLLTETDGSSLGDAPWLTALRDVIHTKEPVSDEKETKEKQKKAAAASGGWLPEILQMKLNQMKLPDDKNPTVKILNKFQIVQYSELKIYLFFGDSVFLRL